MQEGRKYSLIHLILKYSNDNGCSKQALNCMQSKLFEFNRKLLNAYCVLCISGGGRAVWEGGAKGLICKIESVLQRDLMNIHRANVCFSPLFDFVESIINKIFFLFYFR